MSPIAARGAAGEDRLRELLPEVLLPLFDDAFIHSCDLLEEYVHRLTIQIAQQTGLSEAARQPGTAAELAARSGMDPDRAAGVVPWLLELLACWGAVVRDDVGDGTPRYHIPEELPDARPEEVMARQQRYDPAALPAYELAGAAAAAYPEFLAGGRRGEELLFAGDSIDLWLRYFSGDNPLYAINNEVGAIAATHWVQEVGGEWLELGGGGGSGALALLARLQRQERLQSLERYRFTELIPMLLARGRRALLARFGAAAPVAFGSLDMNRRFDEQGVAAGSTTLVYGVNTLHVARDLAFTLGQIRQALAPGGWLVISEGLRPFAGQPIYTELVFLLLDAYRLPRLDPAVRPAAGFLTPEQWETAFLAAGFEDLRFLPNLREIRDAYPCFVVGAVGARRPA